MDLFKRYIDSPTLAFFQFLSNKIQRLFGIDCISLGMLLLHPLIIFSLIEVILTGVFFAFKSILLAAALTTILFLWRALFALLIWVFGITGKKSVGNMNSFRNINEKKLFGMRFFSLYTVLIQIIVVWGIANGNEEDGRKILFGIWTNAIGLGNVLMQFTAYYLISCTPLPPTPGRLSQMLRKLMSKLSDDGPIPQGV